MTATRHDPTVTETEDGDAQAVCPCGWSGEIHPYVNANPGNLAEAHKDGARHIADVRWSQRVA